eukprot:1516272-Alexandrium_andersonii.AAC.1
MATIHSPLMAHGRALLSGVTVGAHDAAQELLGLPEVPGDLRADDRPQVSDPHAHAPGVGDAGVARDLAAEDSN